jgi:hypothetical protein
MNLKATVRNISLIMLLAVTCMATGCASNSGKGGPITYIKGKPPTMGTAQADGRYSLYDRIDTTPIVSYVLRKGDRLGFRQDTPGRITAVAGVNELTLQDGSYTWMMGK